MQLKVYGMRKENGPEVEKSLVSLQSVFQGEHSHVRRVFRLV